MIYECPRALRARGCRKKISISFEAANIQHQKAFVKGHEKNSTSNFFLIDKFFLVFFLKIPHLLRCVRNDAIALLKGYGDGLFQA